MLDIRSLGISFGGIKALQQLDLSVGPSDIVGLIGPNGAGKTTAFNLVTGIYPPSTGIVTLGGRQISGLLPHQVTRAGVSRTFQNIRLFKNLTVLENVLVAQHPQVRYGIATALLRRTGFHLSEAKLEKDALELLDLMGLLPRAREQACNLPYGDQRRLEIARALASGPKPVLLDEPAAGMNSAEGAKLMELIRFIRDRFKVGIVLIEHDMKVVMGVCDRVLVLDHGCPIAEGTPEEIQKNPAVIEAYLGKREDQAPIRTKPAAPGAAGAPA